MKIVDTIKRKYFPHKVKLIAGEEREYLTDLDRAFLYACFKLGIRNNRKGWFSDRVRFNSQEYTTNKFDFFKFNFKVQSKCSDSGHLRELVYSMTLKLSNTPGFWLPYFKFMQLFNNKEDLLSHEVYETAYYIATLISADLGLYIRYILQNDERYTNMSWSRVYEAFEEYFDVKDENTKDDSYYKCKTNPDNLRTKYLKVLGISVEVSKGELKSVYRKLVLKYHPDRGGNPEKFKEITEAYEYLMNN